MEVIDRNPIHTLQNCLQLLLLALSAIHDVIIYQRRKRWLNRKEKTRDFNKERKTKGFYAATFPDLKKDSFLFYKYYRMDLATFNYLLYLTLPFFNLQRHGGDIICEEERLLITLRYLASGDEIISLAVSHRIGITTARGIIKQTCLVIQQALSEVYLRAPNKAAWRNIAKGFNDSWNLPNCIGAVDGKHIGMKAPKNSGSLYFNYKKFFSIVLLACCNHRYEFTCVDVGAFGGESDGGIWSRSEIGKRLENGTLDVPPETPSLPNSNVKTPYYFVGDEAFKLTKNMMRPYPGRNLEPDARIFNYRLSRARRCIENTFGILCARWSVLNRRISFQPEDVKEIVMACICLHNFMMARTKKNVRNKYCPDDFTDSVNGSGDIVFGQWRNEVPADSCFINGPTIPCGGVGEPVAIREALKNYVNSPEGAVSWQNDYINQGKHGESENSSS